jgi:Arm DNA-binding domain
MGEAAKLTDKMVRAIEPPAKESKSDRIVWDGELSGFGARVSKNGVRSFVYNYCVKGAGTQRRMVIGKFPVWSVSAARSRAKELRKVIDAGGDPMGEVAAHRAAPTVNELADRYLAEHAPRSGPAQSSRTRASCGNGSGPNSATARPATLPAPMSSVCTRK